jgi:ribosomal protein S18 acetylase RimI-like enzyme
MGSSPIPRTTFHCQKLIAVINSVLREMIMHISEFAGKHLPFAVRLLNEEYRSAYEFIPFDEERVLSQIQRRHLKVLVAEENGVMLGLIGSHTHEHEEEDVTWLAAAKERDYVIIENLLVNEVEKRSRGDSVSMMIDDGSPRIRNWINRGYVLQPGYQRMSARLDGLRTVPRIDKEIELRSLRTDEEEELITIINAGFGSQRLECGDLKTWKREDPPFNEEWVQVAQLDERLISAVVAKPDTDSIRYLHLNRGYLGPAATLPEFRNKHLASALTAQAMNFLFEKGMNSVRLGTSEQNVSSIALLKRLGFRVDNVRKILMKNLKKA